jgi:uncharacterized glyoxalase superfamily protein PhnB
MDASYKPEGYNSLSPYFIVDGAQKLIDLLKNLFNAKELRRYDMPDGSIMHVELRIDDSVLMLGDSSEKFPSNQQLTHLYVPDVDLIYKKALHLGCETIEAPKQRAGDPDRRATFKDFAGNIWSVGTQLPD